ncbi:hypothetical protein LOTGIDRAFT_157981 [Lottia gigantea]|uniref:DUF885 domain-containing protein n=1 Tax=Lottia gigantea TaxID=225164 RepID=V4AZV7_LOTGI|nr:hypothetical protein LOTGIDRAFT_157981 [Lottia gigantea]ESP00691.1 hypothetical protein LOTGIDRAFT_157981 [Lottia gigantea]
MTRMNFDKIVFFSVVIIMWVLAVLGLIAYTVNGDTALELKELQEEFFQWKLKESPLFATTIGEYKYDDIVQDLSLAHLDQRKVIVDGFIEKLKRIDRTLLPRKTRYSYDIFLDTLQTFVDGYKWKYHGNLNPMSSLEGFQTDPSLILKISPFNTKGDFENFISRLLLYPKQIDQVIIRFSEAITLKNTLHNVSIIAVPDQLAKLIVDDPKKSIYFAPFKDQVHKLDVKNATQDELIKRGAEAIKLYIESISKLKKFLETKYIPNTRQSYGVDGWRDGQDYYKACLKWHLTTDMTPREVHQKGLEEVKRIKEEMFKIMKEKEGITDSIAGFSKILMNRPSLKFNTADELLAEYNKLIHDVIYPKLPEYFKDIPDYKVIVEPEKYDGPAGQYFIGTEDGSRPGIFQVNLLRPNETYVRFFTII